MSPPTDMEAKLLRQIILAGMADQIAKKVSSDEIKENQDKIKWKHAYRYAVNYYQWFIRCSRKFLALLGKIKSLFENKQKELNHQNIPRYYR